jgi:cytochrome c oxidase subunit 6a
MQALRRSASAALPGLRRLATATEANADKFWAPFFPKPQLTAEEVKKNVSKEIVGFMLLGKPGVRRRVRVV